MVKVEIIENVEYKYCFKMSEDDKEYIGGINREYFLTVDKNCPYKELMLRVLINKCMNEFIQRIYTCDVWGTELTKFGFKKQEDIYVSDYFDLKLPHECRC